VFYPEKYPWLRLTFSNADPRTAGVGNMVNCGVAMWMMPVGAVNAGDPRAAYQEAVAMGAAHNESFAVEAGAVMAAAAAEALSPGSSIESVLKVARDLSRDGTHEAIVAAIGAADTTDDLRMFIDNVRQAVVPYDQRAGYVAGDGRVLVASVGDVGCPSRVMSIEELPVALAALKYGDGDFNKTVRSSVIYGRDCDSIAGMACCLYGALFGTASLPEDLRSAVDQANRRDYGALARGLAETVLHIFEKDQQEFEGRRRAITASGGGG
jgi:ADP-ribosylglycohydrolase